MIGFVYSILMECSPEYGWSTLYTDACLGPSQYGCGDGLYFQGKMIMKHIRDVEKEKVYDTRIFLKSRYLITWSMMCWYHENISQKYPHIIWSLSRWNKNTITLTWQARVDRDCLWSQPLTISWELFLRFVLCMVFLVKIISSLTRYTTSSGELFFRYVWCCSCLQLNHYVYFQLFFGYVWCCSWLQSYHYICFVSRSFKIYSTNEWGGNPRKRHQHRSK